MSRRSSAIALITSIIVIFGTDTAAKAGDLTLPFQPQDYYSINAWLDHTSPVTGDPNPTVTRYDGATGVPYNGHRGIDFAVPTGTQVVAAAGGTVVEATSELCGGNYLRVYHPGLEYSTLYFHLQSFIVASGPVTRKQAIAYSDNSGICTDGAHLHFTARNGQSGSDNLDPYGWSGTGNDPWAPGQGFGHLFAIRLGVKGGAGVWANEGTLTAPGVQEDATATRR